MDNGILSASMSYPLGMMDQLTLIVTYDVDANSYYRYFSWQRTWDYVTAHLNLNWNPDYAAPGASPRETGLSAQFMLTAHF